MRFDSAKTYPHPVLRPDSSDYPRAEFEVESTLDRLAGGTELRIVADFRLSDPDLVGLVDSGRAKYVLRVEAPKVHFRVALDSVHPRIDHTFGEGALHGQVELLPFLVCTRQILGFSAAGWHEDYGSLKFDVAPGSVLAQDVPKEYWVDTAEESPVGSIFTLNRDRALRNGTWRCRLAGDKVEIQMAEGDYDRFMVARNRVNRTRDAQYLMNGVYLPALVSVLHEADRDEESHADRRWYRSLQAQLENAKCLPLGAVTADRLVDAQGLLKQPFPRMPLMAEGEAGEEASARPR